MSNFTLHDLEKRVKARAKASADVSYTRKLLDKGVAHCAKKLGEEAVETALAAIGEDRERLIGEAADLIYHLLVLLEARGVALAEEWAALAARTGNRAWTRRRRGRAVTSRPCPASARSTWKRRRRGRAVTSRLARQAQDQPGRKASRSRGHVPALPGKRKIKTRPG